MTCRDRYRSAVRIVSGAISVVVLMGSPLPVLAGGRRNVVDEDFGWGVPGGGQGKEQGKGEVRKAAKPAKGSVGVEIVRLLKRNRRVIEYRQKIRRLLEEKQAIEQAGADDRRTERKVQRIESRIEKYEDRLAREIEKMRKPYEKEYGNLKDKHAALEEKIAKMEEKGRDPKRYQKQLDEIEPRLEELDKILEVLENLEKVDLESDIVPEVAKPFMSQGRKGEEKRRGTKR